MLAVLSQNAMTLKAKLEGKTTTKIETAALDADNVEEVIALIESYKPEAVFERSFTISRF